MTTENTVTLPKLDIISEMALKDWRSLNNVLSALREDQLEQMLLVECAEKKRLDIAVRVHQRYCQVRTARERGEVMAQCEKVKS